MGNFDPEGLIFAFGLNSESIKLYDLRTFDKGPFNTFKLSQDKDCDWTGLKFSPDGKTMLISTNGTNIHLVDAFNGNLLHEFTGEHGWLHAFSKYIIGFGDVKKLVPMSITEIS